MQLLPEFPCSVDMLSPRYLRNRNVHKNICARQAKKLSEMGVNWVTWWHRLEGESISHSHLSARFFHSTFCKKKWHSKCLTLPLQIETWLIVIVFPLFEWISSYASSYLLDAQKASSFNNIYDASRKGRSGEDCAKLYTACNETDWILTPSNSSSSLNWFWSELRRMREILEYPWGTIENHSWHPCGWTNGKLKKSFFKHALYTYFSI